MVRTTLQRHRRSGVVLVDVLVAAIMLGVSLTVLITMTGRALASQRQGEQIATAAMLIDQQLNLVLARGPDDYTSRYAAAGQCDVPFDRFSYSIEFSGGEGGNPYSVIATVSWSDAGRPHSASVETLIAPRLGDDPDPDRRPEQPAVRGY
jgi:Tfp pilus assembly protein PilV